MHRWTNSDADRALIAYVRAVILAEPLQSAIMEKYGVRLAGFGALRILRDSARADQPLRGGRGDSAIHRDRRGGPARRARRDRAVSDVVDRRTIDMRVTPRGLAALEDRALFDESVVGNRIAPSRPRSNVCLPTCWSVSSAMAHQRRPPRANRNRHGHDANERRRSSFMTESPPTTRRMAHIDYKWIALSNTTLGILMAALNCSIILIALPAIFRGIGINPLAPGETGYLLWSLLGYLVITAVLLVTCGRSRICLAACGCTMPGLPSLRLAPSFSSSFRAPATAPRSIDRLPPHSGRRRGLPLRQLDRDSHRCLLRR